MDKTNEQIAPDSSAERSYTLPEAKTALGYNESEWHTSRAPSPTTWVCMTRRLSKAEKAAFALTGVNSLLREHHFASMCAREQDGQYFGITEYQAGCLQDAAEILAMEVCCIFEELRERAAKGNAPNELENKEVGVASRQVTLGALLADAFERGAEDMAVIEDYLRAYRVSGLDMDPASLRAADDAKLRALWSSP